MINLPLDRDAIAQYLPHRGPMACVDEIIELEPGHRAVGLKHVRADDWWCAGHFPGNPVMPGVLIAEALAQVAGVVYLSNHQDGLRRELYLVGMDRLRFRKLVQPGDTLTLEVSLDQTRRQIWWFKVSARVGETVVANGTMMATVREVEDS